MRIIEDYTNISLKRSVDTGTDEERKRVVDIMNQVRHQGDTALRQLTEQLDGVRLDSFRVTEEEIKEAYAQVNRDVVDALQEAADNIRRFHEHQQRNSWLTTSDSGTVLGQLIRPLERVGVYVPGGTAAYPSSLLMNVIPAQVAEVEEIAMVTPPLTSGEVNPGVLIAADLLGVGEIYKAGGAQAIAALAYGTESIPSVDKIVGPGNIYVSLAKREVVGWVDIDKFAGPSEIAVLADENQNPAYIAADLLSQAEHDPLASAVCVTPSIELARRVQAEVEKQMEELPRREIARQSIQDYGAIYVTSSLAEAVHVINQLAPEHVEVLVDDPLQYVGRIKHAGAIFLGPYSTEPVGDYFAGPNHILPTNGTARFSSPLHVDDFVKKTSLISYSKDDLMQHGDKIMHIARYEGLEGHARAIQARLQDEQDEEE